MKKKSLLSWIFLFAKNKKKYYIASIFFALLRVACGIVPYIIIANIVRELLSGVRDWDVYLKECLIIAAFWFGNVLFHSISTTLSHVATFNVLGNIRKDLCDKLSRVPLGSVLDMPSGALKNILVERIDSMETTLAHVVPEFTSNLILPVLMFVYLFHIDWRMGLASLGTLPIGMVAMAVMFAGAQKWFDNSIQKTKALNDTQRHRSHQGFWQVKVFLRQVCSSRKRRERLFCRMDASLHLAAFPCHHGRSCHAIDGVAVWRLLLLQRLHYGRRFYHRHHRFGEYHDAAPHHHELQ